MRAPYSHRTLTQADPQARLAQAAIEVASQRFLKEQLYFA